MKIYIRPRTGRVNAEAIFNVETNEITVLKGSMVSAEIGDFSGAKTVEKLRIEGTKENIVSRDIKFKSPSTAANFVTGSSSNGWKMWKDENGRKLKDAVKELEQ